MRRVFCFHTIWLAWKMCLMSSWLRKWLHCQRTRSSKSRQDKKKLVFKRNWMKVNLKDVNNQQLFFQVMLPCSKEGSRPFLSPFFVAVITRKNWRFSHFFCCSQSTNSFDQQTKLISHPQNAIRNAEAFSLSFNRRHKRLKLKIQQKKSPQVC